MKIRYRRIAERLVDGLRIEQRNRVDDVQRCPANEKLQHDNEEHLDDTLLVLQTFLGVGAAQNEKPNTRQFKLDGVFVYLLRSRLEKLIENCRTIIVKCSAGN